MTSLRIRRRHLAAILTVVVLSIVSYGVYAATQFDRLPSRMAVHFGVDGADGFASTTTAVITLGVLIAVIPLLTVGAFIAVRWWEGQNAPWASGFCAGLAAFLAVVGISVITVNTGLADGADATLSLWWMLVALVVGGLVSLVGLLLPHVPASESRAHSVDPIPLGDTERAAWFGNATMHPALKYGLCAILAVAIVVLALAPGAHTWIALLAVLFAAFAVLSTVDFKVRVDLDGLHWRSLIGVPRGTIALAEIEGVDVIDARPMDYGGFGLRRGGGAFAIMTRTGPALRLLRSGRDFVVTVDDPVGAAGVLEALRSRATR